MWFDTLLLTVQGCHLLSNSSAPPTPTLERLPKLRSLMQRASDQVSARLLTLINAETDFAEKTRRIQTSCFTDVNREKVEEEDGGQHRWSSRFFKGPLRKILFQIVLIRAHKQGDDEDEDGG